MTDNKFRKKPVIVEAVKYAGDGNLDPRGPVPAWMFSAFESKILMATNGGDPLVIKTSEGDLTVSVGDYIIRGVDGELFACKPDVFEKMYERVREAKATTRSDHDISELGNGWHFCSKCGKSIKSPERRVYVGTNVENLKDYHEALHSMWAKVECVTEALPERFVKPTDQQIVKAAILFNDGKIEEKKLQDMVALADWVIDRLYDNGNISEPSLKEKEDGKV